MSVRTCRFCGNEISNGNPMCPCRVGRNTCAYLGKGFCAASVDGYCIGGYLNRFCHG